MRLSVCMIARDEAERLPLALQSVRDIADEIIVVDTGSVDDTVAVARHAGARVFHHPWNDDFAAARNAAVPHIRGKWMLILDCDEQLAPEGRDTLDAMLAREDALGYGLRRNDYVGGFKATAAPGPYVASIVIRLLRADMGLRFTGRCHEQPDPCLNDLSQKTGLKLYSCPLTLNHDCEYFGAGRAKKSVRNGRLLEMEVRERPGRLYFMTQCAVSLLEAPESIARGHVMMREVLEKIAELRDAPRPPYSILLLALEYAAFHHHPGPIPFTPDEAIELADRWFPDAAPVVWMRARRAHDRGDFEAAIPPLRRLLNMGRTHAYDLQLPFDPAIINDDARLNLGVCLLRQGHLEEAESLFQQIPPTSPRRQEAQSNLAAVASLRGQFVI
jgi:tetratricopeptide (TPR) repeat protein